MHEERTEIPFNIIFACMTVFIVGYISIAIAMNLHGGGKEHVIEIDWDAEDSVALTWMQSFVNRDFKDCDTYVANQDARFYSPLVITQGGSSDFYDLVLRSAVNCIDSINLISVSDTGDYKFEVTLHRYAPVTKFDLDPVESLRGSYLGGGVDDLDFVLSLQYIYSELFSNSCLSLSREQVTVVTVLSEYEFEGISSVLGTSDFFDLILHESGLAANINAYETSIKEEVSELLQQGG